MQGAGRCRRRALPRHQVRRVMPLRRSQRQATHRRPSPGASRLCRGSASPSVLQSPWEDLAAVAHPRVALANVRSVSLSLQVAVWSAGIDADFPDGPIFIATGDHLCQSSRSEVPKPGRVRQIVAERSAGAAVGILGIDEDADLARHHCGRKTNPGQGVFRRTAGRNSGVTAVVIIVRPCRPVKIIGISISPRFTLRAIAGPPPSTGGL